MTEQELARAERQNIAAFNVLSETSGMPQFVAQAYLFARIIVSLNEMTDMLIAKLRN